MPWAGHAERGGTRGYDDRDRRQQLPAERRRTRRIVNSNVNAGEGTQIVASADADKQDVLLAVETIVRAGLAGDWSEDAAKDLASVVNDRSDLDYEDVQNLGRIATR